MFTKDILDKISVNMDEEWEFNDKECSVMLSGAEMLLESMINGKKSTTEDAVKAENGMHASSTGNGMETGSGESREKKEANGWVDIYAFMDPLAEIVKSIYAVYEDAGSEEGFREIEINVILEEDQESLFGRIKETGGKEFADFLSEAQETVRTRMSETLNRFVEAVEEFLEEKHIRLKTSDEEMKRANISAGNARIFGEDYDNLIEKFGAIYEECMRGGAE